MNNKYIYIGNDLIAGPVEFEKPNKQDKEYHVENMVDWHRHIASLPKIEVNGTHSWEINQVLEKDIDFVIAESSLKEGKIIEAIPLSKPNTDVKQNTQYSEQNYSKGEGEISIDNPGKENI